MATKTIKAPIRLIRSEAACDMGVNVWLSEIMNLNIEYQFDDRSRKEYCRLYEMALVAKMGKDEVGMEEVGRAFLDLYAPYWGTVVEVPDEAGGPSLDGISDEFIRQIAISRLSSESPSDVDIENSMKSIKKLLRSMTEQRYIDNFVAGWRKILKM